MVTRPGLLPGLGWIEEDKAPPAAVIQHWLRASHAIVAQDPGRHLHQDLASFLDEQRSAWSVFIKYPDTYSFYRYVEESIKMSWKSHLVITPDTNSNINLHQSDWSANWKWDNTDDERFYGNVSLDKGDIVAITYSELRSFNKLPKEIKQKFFENIWGIYALDIAGVRKWELEILGYMQQESQVPCVYHSTWVDFVVNQNLWEIYSQSNRQERPLTIDDLVQSWNLQYPEFHTLTQVEWGNSVMQIIEQYEKIRDSQTRKQAIWYCESQEQLENIQEMLNNRWISNTHIDAENAYANFRTLGQVKEGNIDVVLVLWSLGGNIDMSMFQWAMFFYSPKNWEMSSQVLSAMQKPIGWGNKFIIDMKSWPANNTLTPTNRVAQEDVDADRISQWVVHEERNREAGVSSSRSCSPGVRQRLVYLWEMGQWELWERENRIFDDRKLLEATHTYLNEMWYTDLAHIEKLNLSSLKWLIGDIPELREFLRRHLGSFNYVNTGNRRYIFEDLIGFSFLSQKTYEENCREYLRSFGIVDYASCVNHPVKKTRAKTSSKTSFREMKDSADFYYMYCVKGWRDNISDFDSSDRRKLTERLYENEVWDIRMQLQVKLETELWIKNYVDLLYFYHRVEKKKGNTFAALKTLMLSTDSFKNVLKSLDIVPSKFSKDHIPKLGTFLWFDMSDQWVYNEFWIQINTLLNQGDGWCRYVYLDWMMYMGVGVFCEKVLSQNPAMVLFAKHFMSDKDIKPSRITDEQKQQLTTLLWDKIKWDNRILNILDYKGKLEGDFEEKELSLHNLECAQVALVESRHFAIFLASQMGIWHISDIETLKLIHSELDTRNIDL